MVARDLPADSMARRFLLDDLDEPEQSAIEQQLIESGEVQERLALVESELVDDYLHNRLPPQDRARFERRYLTHAEGVRKVDFARLLRRRMTGGEEQRPVAAPALRRRWLAVAASLLMAGLTGILSWQTWQTRQALEIKEAEIAAAQARERALAERLRVAEGQLDRVQKEREAAPPAPSPPPSEPSAPSFLLHPGTLRDAGSAAQTVVLSGVSRSIRLELAWPADPALTYRAVIQTPDQVEVWSAEGLASRGKEGSTVLVLPVPAGVLRPGDYILRLQARERQADWESVADYSFRVTLRHLRP
jgi:hypothetical protein